MNEDCIVRMVNFPGDVRGAVRLSEDDFANIYINDNLSPMARLNAYLHERNHIKRNDLYNDKTITEVEGCDNVNND